MTGWWNIQGWNSIYWPDSKFKIVLNDNVAVSDENQTEMTLQASLQKMIMLPIMF